MRSFALKAFVLLVICAVLAIALSVVSGIVHDRMRFRDEARASIAQSFAGRQLIAGPTLLLRYEERYVEERTDIETGRTRITKINRSKPGQLVLMPDVLAVSGTLDVQPRYRGLFKVNTYASDVSLSGAWSVPNAGSIARTEKDSQIVVAPDAVVVFHLSDSRGIQAVTATIDGATQTAIPGSSHPRNLPGIHLKLPANTLLGRSISFEGGLKLAGTEGFDLLPIGKENSLKLSSTWRHPSFEGQSLPVAREVTANGFNAEWKITSLASQARQMWSAGFESSTPADARASDFAAERLGVRLIDPVDIYTLADRATKYGLLLIVLILGGFSMVELLKRLRLHPIQYTLCGAVLVVFFLLLLALAEQLGFASAYLGASAASTMLLSIYSASIMGSWKRSVPIAVGLAALFGSLYVILQSEQNAILIGSVFLFTTLAAVMIGTRKLNWFELFENNQTAAQTMPQPRAQSPDANAISPAASNSPPASASPPA